MAQLVPLGRQNSQEDKIVCNMFLVHRLTERDEIWHDDGHWSVAAFKRFWSTLVQFSPPYGVRNFRKRVYGTLFVGARRNLAAFRPIRTTVNTACIYGPYLRVVHIGRYSPNLLNSDPGRGSRDTMRRHVSVLN